MGESNEKNELIRTMLNVEYHPAVVEEQAITAKYTKLPLSRVPALGIAFEPLAAAFQNVVNGGGATSGLYKVTIKNGGHLAELKDGSGYIGSILKPNGAVGGGQAVLNPLIINPTTLFMAAALMNIEKKLDSIQEAQQEIIDFLEQKEKSELKGDLDTLADILNNYKYNWNNEKYKTNKHIHVQEIKRNAAQKTDFYREQIEKKLSKQSLLHRNQDVNKKLSDAQYGFKNYQLALYLYSFSSFLEVMLLENFDSAYLDSVAHKIEDYSYQYRILYAKSYDQIEEFAKSSLETHILKSLASVNKVAGKAVAKVPIVSKSQIDETLIESGERLGKFSSQKAEQTMKQFKVNQNSGAYLFAENIKIINRLYNQPMELLFDKENLYVGVAES